MKLKDFRLGAKNKVIRDKNGLSWGDKRDKILLEYFGSTRKRKTK